MYKTALLISESTIELVNNNSNTNAKCPMNYVPVHSHAEELLKFLSYLLQI